MTTKTTKKTAKTKTTTKQLRTKDGKFAAKTTVKAQPKKSCCQCSKTVAKKAAPKKTATKKAAVKTTKTAKTVRKAK